VKNIASRNHDRNTLIICTVNKFYPLITLSSPCICSINYGLFNDAVIISDYTVSNLRNKKCIWKDVQKKWPNINLRCCPDISLKGQNVSLPAQTDRYPCREFEAKTSQIIGKGKFLGFRSGEVEAFVLQERGVASLVDWYPAFRDSVPVSSPRVKCPPKLHSQKADHNLL
jgi:hypothetical protein